MSFDNLDNNNFGKTVKVNLLFLILIGIAASVATVFVPFLSFAALAFVPVPVTLLIALNRIRDAVICAITGILVFLLLNYVVAIVFFIVLLCVSFGYRYFLSKKIRIPYIIGAIFLVFILSVLLFFLIDSAIIHKNSFREVSNFYKDYVNTLEKDSFLQNYKSILMVNDSQFDEVVETTKSLLLFFPKILPGLIVLVFGSASILNYIFTGIFFKKYNIETESFPVFIKWDLPWYWCWGIITGIILLIVPSFNIGYKDIFYVIGANILIVFGFVYLVLGLSVLWGVLEKFNIKNTMKIVIIIAVFLFLGLFVLIPILGLIDIWVNFRKLERVHG
jgi:uncharacterized protein YybS (DUF2232 family)